MSGASVGVGRRGEVITFYSFKGGVGRSMALANIAALEAQRGKRVLALDFDFEAPGLHRYFLKSGRYEPERGQRGVLNLFAALRDKLGAAFPLGKGLENADAASKLRVIIAEQLDSGEYAYKVQVDDPNSRQSRTVSVDFIAAAKLDGTYPELVRTFDWQRFYDDYAEVFPALVEELVSRYDMILVDSRTGVTDIGSICTMALPDKLVLVFSPNEQSLAGALDAGWQAVQGRKEAGADRPLGIFPLVSRVEEGEEQQKRAWIKRARESFEKLAGEAYGVEGCDLEAYFDAVRIPHRSYYAYGERIAAEEQPVRETGSLAQVYDRLADSLECAGVVEAQRGLAPDDKPRSDPLTEVMIKVLEASKLIERPSEAVRAYDDVIPRLLALPAQEELDVDGLLNTALGQKLHALKALHRGDEAVAVCEELIRRYGESGDIRASEISARVWIDKLTSIAEQGDPRRAVAECDEMLRRFSDSPEPGILQHVIIASAIRSSALWDLGQRDDALLELDGLMLRVGTSRSPELVSSIATALFQKSVYLRDMGRRDDAKAVRADIVRRFRGETDGAAQMAVAGALVDEANALNNSGLYQDALTVIDDFLALFPDGTNPHVSVGFYRVTVLRGLLLVRLERYSDAVASADQAYDQLTAADDAEARVLIPRVLEAAGFARLCLAKQTWQGGNEAAARTLLQEAESKLESALDLAPADPHMMGDAAYTAFLLGHHDQARDLLTQAIAQGGTKLREAELKDADICPLPQDDAWRELVRSIPDPPT